MLKEIKDLQIKTKQMLERAEERQKEAKEMSLRLKKLTEEWDV